MGDFVPQPVKRGGNGRINKKQGNEEDDQIELTDQVLAESIHDSQYRHDVLNTETEEEKAQQASLEY